MSIDYADLGLDVPPRQPTDQWLASLPQDQQRAYLGPKRYDAWKSGDLRFSETGRQWFERQPEAAQRAQMGPRKWEAWKAGKFGFEDLSIRVPDRVWGVMRVETPLKTLLKDGPGAAPAAAPPVPKPRPGGTAVSGALGIPAGNTGQPFAGALATVDGIHGDGNLPKIPVRITSGRVEQGAYVRDNATSRPLRIDVSRKADSSAFSFLHELGHFLDYAGTGGPRDPSSATNIAWAEWRSAVRSSRAYGELQALAGKKVETVTLASGRQTRYNVDHKYVQYALANEEIFARSYAQYIALRSGDRALMDAVKAELRRPTAELYYPIHWEADDFEPIAAAIDSGLRRLRWVVEE